MSQSQNAPAPQGGAPKKQFSGFQAKAKERTMSYYIWSVISLIIMFGFGSVVKPWSTVTPVGVAVIGIFLGLLVAIITTNDLLWPSLAAMVALFFYGYYETSSAAIAGVFGNTTVFQFIMMQSLIRPVITSGAGEVIARWLLTRKFVQKRPLVITFVFFFAFIIASNFMAAFGTIFLAFPILRSFLTQAGYEMKDKYSGFMFLGTFIAAMTGTAVKTGISAAGLVKIGYYNTALEGTGLSVNVGQMTVLIIAVQLIFYIVYTLSIKFIFRCDLSKLSNTDFRKMEGMMDNLKMNKKQIIYLGAFIVYVLYSFVAGYVPKTTRFGAFFSGMGIYMWAAVVVIIMGFLATKDPKSGKLENLFNIGRTMKDAVSWDMAFVLGAFTVIGGAISGKASGVQPWLTEAFGPILGNKPAIVFVFLVILLSTVVTNFFSNMATGNIFAALSAPLCKTFCVAGLNPAILPAVLALSAHMSYLTYASCGPAPLLLEEEACNKKFIWSYGVGVIVIFIVVATLVLLVADLII